VLHGCVTDVEEADKLQTLLTTGPDEAWNRGSSALVGRNHPSVLCARMRPRRRRHCSRMHLASRRQSIPRCPPRFVPRHCSLEFDVSRERWVQQLVIGYLTVPLVTSYRRDRAYEVAHFIHTPAAKNWLFEVDSVYLFHILSSLIFLVKCKKELLFQTCSTRSRRVTRGPLPPAPRVVVRIII